MVLTKFMYSILWVDGVGLLIFSRITLSLVLSRSGHDLFPKILCPLNPGEVPLKSGSSYLACLSSILRNYRNLLASTIYGFSCRKMAGVESHRISYDWQRLPVKGSIILPFYGFMAYHIDTILRFSSLSDFPSTYGSS